MMTDPPMTALWPIPAAYLLGGLVWAVLSLLGTLRRNDAAVSWPGLALLLLGWPILAVIATALTVGDYRTHNQRRVAEQVAL